MFRIYAQCDPTKMVNLLADGDGPHEQLISRPVSADHPMTTVGTTTKTKDPVVSRLAARPELRNPRADP
jgi:hypothetical protein